MVNLVSTLTARLIDQISGPAKGATAAVTKLSAAEKALARLEAQAGKTTALKGQLEDLAKSKRAWVAQKQAVIDLAQAQAKQAKFVGPQTRETTKLIAAQAAELGKARDKLKALGAAMESNKSTAMATKRGLEQIIGPINTLASAEAKLAAHTSRANAALKQQAAAAQRSARRREALGTVGGAVAGYAAYRGVGYGLDAIQQAADFDIAVRKMRVYSDLKAGQDAGLIAQAKRIGQQTQFSNIDVVHAQATSMQGLSATFSPELKAAVAEGILENVKNYATLMDANLAEGAETIRTYLATTRRDISSKEKALFEANKATNQVVKMAKLGGMSNEDVQGYLKFALPSATAAGITPEAALAMGAVLRRGGYRGEEAGVAMRNFANKMISPTAGGKAALTAAGLDYNKYVNPAQSMNVDNLITHLGNSVGTAATPALRTALAKVVSDPKLMANSAAFNAAVADAVEGPAKTGKGGNTANRKKVSKAAGKFWNLSAESIDVQRLFDDLMSSNMSLGQLNELFSGKFGGKFALSQQARDEYNAARGSIGHAAEDPDFAAKKATEVMAGLGGSLENLKGSFDNLILSMGQANERWLKPAMDGIGNVVDAVSNLSEPARMAATALAGVAAAVGLTKGAGAVLGGLFGKGGGAEALIGSATALDGSAAALTRAAVALGGKDVASSGAKAAAGAAAAGGTGWLGRVVGGAGRMIGAAGGILMIQAVANSTSPSEDKALADAAAGTSGVRAKYGDDTLRAARSAYQPWWKRTSTLDASDSDDQSYVDRYLAGGGPSLAQIAAKYPQGATGISRAPNAGWTPPSSGGQNYQTEVAKAEQAGQQIQQALSPTAAPTIDTSGLQAAVALAERFLSLMRSAGAAAINTSHLAPKAVPAPMTTPAYGKGD
ncbi:hypothetical protein BA190_10250 [Labrys sp. WJW]|uniref:phage tail tape measure protein n=1 Tax=Labrys sp. WJW TaxID=1737983 RepID=UPI000830C1B6|nr:phage tail tape measure protein [Labrys sp. WJW]OCC05275.1 hypothetical protein BA190_10250 [Labrys sp. WJW]